MKPSTLSPGSFSQAEHWLRILAESSPTAVLIHSNTIRFANAAAEELTGFSVAELVGMRLSDLFGPNVPPAKAERVLHRDGTPRWVRSSSTMVEMAGEPAHLLSLIDVTEQHRAMGRLREVERELELTQREARVLIWRWYPDSDRLDLSANAGLLLGPGAEDQITTGRELLSAIYPDDRDRLRQAISRSDETGEAFSLDFRCSTTRGEVRWFQCSGSRDSESATRVLGIAQDITEQRMTEKALFQERDRAFVALSSIGDGVIRTDARGKIDYLNPVAQRLTGWSLPKAYGRPVAEIYQAVDELTGRFLPNPVQQCLREHREVFFLGQRLLTRQDGTRFPIQDSAVPIRDRDGEVTGVVLVFRDLTQMRQIEEEIQHLTSHDPLTGLANRREFELILRELTRTAPQHRHRSVLCQLDLDAFKLVNDTCGHDAGDQLIRQIATLLQQCVHPHDLLARLGVDEFAVLFRDCTTEEALQRAEEICSAIHDSRFHWLGHTFTPRVSAGLVPLTLIAEGPESLLAAADAACFVAKDSGGGRIHVFEAGDSRIAERYGQMQWISRIQRGLDESRFCLWQQGITRLDSALQEPPLAELLIRLIDEEGNVVKPGSFIPAAERYGQIAALDRWVVKTALSHMARAGLSASDRRFAINISGKSLGAEGFLDYITQTIEHTGVTPQRLLFEITETSAIANLPNAMYFISSLKEMGCLFVLDDFGQGLSSFGYLKSLPLDFIKIDGAFVRGMASDPVQAALVSSIRDIGEVMGLRTIAESVENRETYEALVELGVDYVQGYYLQRPQPLTTGSTPAVNRPPGT